MSSPTENPASENGNRLEHAVPILASLDIEKTVEFYRNKLGFETKYAQPGEYAIVQRDTVQIHFWNCDDKRIPQLTACRVGVNGISSLYEEYRSTQVVHPNGSLGSRPWGTTEFAVLDGDGNCITFFERAE